MIRIFLTLAYFLHIIVLKIRMHKIMKNGSRMESYNNLKKIRNQKNMTQSELCNELKKYGCYVCRSTYSKYETGYRQIPSDILIFLSKCLKVSTDYILGISND